MNDVTRQVTYVMSTKDSFLFFTYLPDLISAIHAVEDISGKPIPETVRYYAQANGSGNFELEIVATDFKTHRSFGLADDNRIAFDKWFATSKQAPTQNIPSRDDILREMHSTQSTTQTSENSK